MFGSGGSGQKSGAAGYVQSKNIIFSAAAASYVQQSILQQDPNFAIIKVQ